MEVQYIKNLEYINRNGPQIERFSNDLMHMMGRKAWRNILKYSKNMKRDILSEYTKDPEMNKKLRGHLINSYHIN